MLPNRTTPFSIGHAEKTIPFSLNETIQSIFERYPNPFSKHIQSSDTISPFRLGSDGELFGKCLTLKTNPIPQWFKNKNQVGYKRQGVQCIAIAEEFLVDAKSKCLWHLSRNLNSREYLKTHELVQYGGRGDGEQTFVTVTKRMGVSSPVPWPLQSMMRQFTVNRWLKNERRATHGLCYTIAKNLYCQELANEFHDAGLNDGALQTMKTKIHTMREQKRQLFQSVREEMSVAMQNPKNIQKLAEVVKKAPRP